MTEKLKRSSCYQRKMGFMKLMIIAALLAIAVMVAPAMAAEFVVGDKDGWKLNIDYKAWANGKKFNVGDKLVFSYAEGLHNVAMVDKEDYDSCIQPNNTRPLTDGNDVVTLASPGKKWYICSIGNHCKLGMKLEIDVQLQGSSSPHSFSKSSSAAEIFAPKFFVSIIPAAVFIIILMI